MARNSVAANLLMFIFVAGGLAIGLNVKQEIFPEFELDIVQVSVDYPGASPKEVEEGIILSVENEVRSIEGIKKVEATSFEGRGIVNIELITGVDGGIMLQDVKNAVDRIRTFPEDAERPIVSLVDPRRQVISLMVYGGDDKKKLREIGESIRDDLINTEGITLVELEAVPPLEISIEVPRKNLRTYNLTLEQIADIVRKTAVDIPAGGVKAASGEVLLRTKERRNYASEFENIPIVITDEGTEVLLRDLAQVKEIFEETDEEAFYNGQPAVKVDVYRVGKQNPIDIAGIVRDYVDKASLRLPEGIKIDSWYDRSEIFNDRINLLLRNAFLGLVLVLLFLALFLEPRLAFWVTLGIPISIIGSFLFIPITGASINMISLFAFIITLGIVVDDAILVGENIYHMREKGMSFLHAAIEGAQQISGPVTFAVLTNIAAFLPLFFVPGSSGKLFLQIPAIVVSVLIVSLVESLFVIPAHLTRPNKESRFWQMMLKPSQKVEKLLANFIENIFTPFLKKTLNYRYLTFTIGLSIMFLSVSNYFGGHLQFSYLPRVDSDVVGVKGILPFGVPIETTRKVKDTLVDKVNEVIEEVGGEKTIRGIYTQIGSPIRGFAPLNPAREMTGSHLVTTQIFLVPANERTVSGFEFANKWREAVGEIPNVDSMNFIGTIQTAGGSPIDIQLSHPDTKTLESAAKELAAEIARYDGIKDLDDGVTVGKPQISFKLKPEARSLNITSRNLAEQVRGAFYGAEALRQQRGQNEMKVMVRLPKNETKTVFTVEDLIIRTPEGGEIPLAEAADVTFERAFTNIRRVDGRRTLSVTADVNDEAANANQILESLEEETFPELMSKYPGLIYKFEGEQREQQEILGALGFGFILALFVIYALLAIPFKSYIQPLIVMLSIPFGVIGAVLGHLLLGYELSIMSMFGMVALAGVVVNDSLVLVVTINANLKEGAMSAFDAVVDGCKRRFRPIMLTSLTTFFGLSPMIFEPSMQARFLIPMAISLGFGILFSTGIIMFITSSVYLIISDMKKLT